MSVHGHKSGHRKRSSECLLLGEKRTPKIRCLRSACDRPICDIGGIAQALREYPFSKVGMRLRPYVTLDYADATASCKLVGQPKIIGSFHATKSSPR